MSDPTENLRADFIDDFSDRFDNLRDRIERVLGPNLDVFGLAADAEQPRTASEIADDSPRVLRFASRRQNVAAFAAWLEQAIDDEVLRPVDGRTISNGGHWTGQHIRAAYSQGWLQARERVRHEGVSVGSEPEVEAIFGRPVAVETLSRFYQRTYEDLRDLSGDSTGKATAVLTNALSDGVNPREAGRRVSEAIDEIEENRAKVVARTRTMDTYTDATIDRYRNAGVSTVRHGEFSDSSDSRVCPICESLDGEEIPLPTIESETFEFEPAEDEPDSLAGTYGKKPPIHPNGRCVLLPVI